MGITSTPDPYYQDEIGTIYQGHAPVVLPQMAPRSVQCVITSPPYWGLRDYGLEPQIWDENPENCYTCPRHNDPPCDVCHCTGKEHEWGKIAKGKAKTNPSDTIHKEGYKDAFRNSNRYVDHVADAYPAQGQFCQLCNAWRGSLGLEPTPELYVRHMVEVFREVRRVMRPDATLWINLGDSYMAGQGGRQSASGLMPLSAKRIDNAPWNGQKPRAITSKVLVTRASSLKPKDLCMIPARVALALQADGWYLRSDIIWSKPNPMPESVRDRPTKAHEYLFLLTKSPRYFFDQEAVRESDKGTDHWRATTEGQKSLEPSGGLKGPHRGIRTPHGRNGSGRNIRTVWTIPTAPFPEAHFATFPPKLVEPCIKAGSREGDTVLDPFGGSGTVGMVAEKLGRKWIIIDLSEKYCEMAKNRIQSKAWGPTEEGQANWVQESLL